jgi:hypothetical protein
MKGKTMKQKASGGMLIKFCVEVGRDDLEAFGRLVRALYDGGFQAAARGAVSVLIKEAERREVDVPAELRAFAAQIIQ